MKRETQRRRERVRRIVRLRLGFQPEQHADHLLDLLLIRMSVAAHRLLDLHRRELIHRNAGLLHRQKRDAASGTDRDRCRDVVVKEQLLERRHVGLKQLAKLPRTEIQPLESFGKRRIFVRFDHAEIDRYDRLTVLFDHAVAHDRIARIDSQDAHADPPNKISMYYIMSSEPMQERI